MKSSSVALLSVTVRFSLAWLSALWHRLKKRIFSWRKTSLQQFVVNACEFDPHLQSIISLRCLLVRDIGAKFLVLLSGVLKTPRGRRAFIRSRPCTNKWCRDNSFNYGSREFFFSPSMMMSLSLKPSGSLYPQLECFGVVTARLKALRWRSSHHSHPVH